MSMKRIMALLLILALVLAPLAACSRRRGGEGDGAPGRSQAAQTSGPESPEPDDNRPEPDAATPQGAVAELFEGAKSWDLERINGYLPEGTDLQSMVPDELQGGMRRLLDRMDYAIGAAAVDGDRAVVQVTVTAADAESAMNDAVAAAVSQVVKSKLTGREISYPELAKNAVEAIDIGSLPDKTMTVDAYLLREDGRWRLDAANKANMPLLNAVSGGVIDLYGQFRELAEGYGLGAQS